MCALFGPRTESLAHPIVCPHRCNEYTEINICTYYISSDIYRCRNADPVAAATWVPVHVPKGRWGSYGLRIVTLHDKVALVNTLSTAPKMCTRPRVLKYLQKTYVSSFRGFASDKVLAGEITLGPGNLCTTAVPCMRMFRCEGMGKEHSLGLVDAVLCGVITRSFLPGI